MAYIEKVIAGPAPRVLGQVRVDCWCWSGQDCRWERNVIPLIPAIKGLFIGGFVGLFLGILVPDPAFLTHAQIIFESAMLGAGIGGAAGMIIGGPLFLYFSSCPCPPDKSGYCVRFYFWKPSSIPFPFWIPYFAVPAQGCCAIVIPRC